MNWALIRPRTPSARRDARHRRHDQVLVGLGDALRRVDADRVARVHAGALDVLDQARDEHVLAVADGVDVHLEALEDSRRCGPAGPGPRPWRRPAAGPGPSGRSEVDGEPADDEARADDDRVADPLGDRQRLLERLSPCRLRAAECRAGRRGRRSACAPRPGRWPRGEPAQRDAGGASGPARLSGVWPPNCDDAGRRPAPAGDLGVDHLEHALRVERLEVQPRVDASKSVETVSGLELTITALPARRAERVGGLDGAVVELDPLPDPHRAGADDERAGRATGGASGGEPAAA